MGNVVFIAITASDISILSRANTDVTDTPDTTRAGCFCFSPHNFSICY